jgi:hypothetical protein
MTKDIFGNVRKRRWFGRDSWLYVYEKPWALTESAERQRPQTKAPQRIRPPELPARLYYAGVGKKLRRLIKESGNIGIWLTHGDIEVFRAERGAILSWSPIKGMVWFQGDAINAHEIWTYLRDVGGLTERRNSATPT